MIAQFVPKANPNGIRIEIRQQDVEQVRRELELPLWLRILSKPCLQKISVAIVVFAAYCFLNASFASERSQDKRWFGVLYIILVILGMLITLSLVAIEFHVHDLVLKRMLQLHEQSQQLIYSCVLLQTVHKYGARIT